MLNIFLDDSPDRTRKFRSIVPSAHCVEKAIHVIALLHAAEQKKEIVDWLFLDHDLGGETWVDSSRADCGMEVVRYLCREAEAFKPLVKRIVVHSHNVSAADEMEAKLKDAGYRVLRVPFITLMKTLSFSDSSAVVDPPPPPNDPEDSTY